MDFINKVVLVTGSSSGIGAQTAIDFAKAGAKVALIGRNKLRLELVADKIKNNGSPTPFVIVADVTTDAKQIIDQTIQHFGQLDVLVNNAGIAQLDTVSTVDFEKYDNMFAINCRAPIELTKLSAPYLEKTKGNVVNVSSIAAFLPVSCATSYCVIKSALDMFTKCASLEFASKGIRVNSVNPGTTNTPILQTYGFKDDDSIRQAIQNEAKKYPLGRIGEVGDVSNAILFLANEKSNFITGVILPVDGGKCIS